jgi:hypothetical protein
MSWLYVPESAGSSSELRSSSPRPDAWLMWKGKPFQPRSLSAAWKKEPWIRRLSGLTCEPSTLDRGVASWIASLRASRANPSAGPDAGRSLTTSIGSGTTCSGPPASSTHPSSSARTWTHSALTEECGSWKTLPHAGSISHGIFSPLAPSEPRILARDSSFSPQNGTAWTTPCGDDTGLRRQPYAQGGIPTSLQVRRTCWHNAEPDSQNPAFTDALMGLPPDWSNIESGPGATRLCLWLQQMRCSLYRKLCGGGRQS